VWLYLSITTNGTYDALTKLPYGSLLCKEEIVNVTRGNLTISTVNLLSNSSESMQSAYYFLTVGHSYPIQFVPLYWGVLFVLVWLNLIKLAHRRVNLRLMAQELPFRKRIVVRRTYNNVVKQDGKLYFQVNDPDGVKVIYAPQGADEAVDISFEGISHSKIVNTPHKDCLMICQKIGQEYVWIGTGFLMMHNDYSAQGKSLSSTQPYLFTAKHVLAQITEDEIFIRMPNDTRTWQLKDFNWRTIPSFDVAFTAATSLGSITGCKVHKPGYIRRGTNAAVVHFTDGENTCESMGRLLTTKLSPLTPASYSTTSDFDGEGTSGAPVFCGTTLVGLHLAHKKKDKVNLFAPFLWMAGYNTIKTYKKESHGVAPQDISADRFSNEAEELNWYDRHHGNEDYDDFEYEREIDSRDIHEADEDFQRFFERSWKDDDSDDFEVDNDFDDFEDTFSREARKIRPDNQRGAVRTKFPQQPAHMQMWTALQPYISVYGFAYPANLTGKGVCGVLKQQLENAIKIKPDRETFGRYLDDAVVDICEKLRPFSSDWKEEKTDSQWKHILVNL